MTTIAELSDFYKQTHWGLISVCTIVLCLRVWRVIATRRDRMLIFTVKGFYIEKGIKAFFAIAMMLVLFGSSSLFLVASTTKSLIPSYQTNILVGLLTTIALMELVLAGTVSRSLLEKRSKKGVLILFSMLTMFIYSQIVGMSIHIFEVPSSDIILNKFPVEKGQWLVLEGGNSNHLNYNNFYSFTEYGYDIERLDGEKFYGNSSTENNHYFSYDKVVLSPVNGRVVAMIDSVDDHKPSLMIEISKYRFGNYVSIEMTNGTYIVLSNLKKKSIQVKLNDVVNEGAPLARIGNSGTSAYPKLHFHIQNKPSYDTTAVGYAFFFKEIERHRWLTTKTVQNTYLIRNDMVTIP